MHKVIIFFIIANKVIMVIGPDKRIRADRKGSGDVMGAVVMLTGESAKIPTGVEIKLAQSAAAFLGKQMEN